MRRLLNVVRVVFVVVVAGVVAVHQFYIDHRSSGSGASVNFVPLDGATSSAQAPSSTQPASAASAPKLTAIPHQPPTRQVKTFTVMLDPGHAGTDLALPDKVTVGGHTYMVLDHDYPNTPEITEVWNVSKLVANVLAAHGIRVVWSKSSANADLTPPSQRATGPGELWRKAQAAITNHVDLAVSIHDDHTAGSSFAPVFTQGSLSPSQLWRADESGHQITLAQIAGSGAATLASQSQQCGQLIAQARTAAEGRASIVATNDFSGRGSGIAPGNMPWVMMFGAAGQVPWVYTEYGAKSGINLSAYATGIANGILACRAQVNGL